jgi:hypothetical protein
MEEVPAPVLRASSPTAQTISFLSLPPEIRLRIYRFLFIKGFDGRDDFDSSGDSEVLMPAPYVVKHNRDMTSQASNDQPHLRGWRRSSQFLRCCRACALEGRPILYGENTFYVDAPSAISFFVRQMTSNSAKIWLHHLTLSDSWTRYSKSNHQRHIHEIQTLHALKTLRINMLLRPEVCYWPPRSDQYSFKALFNPKALGTFAEIQRRLGGPLIHALLTNLKGVRIFVDATGPEYRYGEQATCKFVTQCPTLLPLAC